MEFLWEGLVPEGTGAGGKEAPQTAKIQEEELQRFTVRVA